MEVNSPVPFGLYKLTALLVKEEFIDLYSIYSHLLPTDEEAFEHYNVFLTKRLDEANKIEKINLAATGKYLMDNELFVALDMEIEAVSERAPELENSQTLGLLLGFLAVDDWLIGKSISSVYALVRETHLQSLESSSGASVEPMETESSSLSRPSIVLPKELFQILSIVRPYLHCDTILLQKVLKGYYLSALERVGGGDGPANLRHVTNENRDPRLHLMEARSRVEESLGACLLPSLQLIPTNPVVGQEIWEVLN